MTVNRRGFLRGVTAGAAGTALGAGAAAVLAAPPDRPAFHGERQAGVLPPAPPHAVFAAFDVEAGPRDVFRTLTDRARFLTGGGTPAARAAGDPPADSGVVGPVVAADGLTVTVSVGASLFDGRFGLAARRPPGLTAMPAFGNDALEAAWTGGDVMLQICAQNADTVHHALRDIARHTRGGLLLRYRMNGFLSPPRPEGTPRNLFGFKDGTANPTPPEAESLVWTEDGGSYQVVRLIRMFTEFWDRISLTEQEGIFGRRRDTGAPLDGADEHDVPGYARDPDGRLIPLDAHMRLANPRTDATHGSRILRRGYNYDAGTTSTGDLDAGLVFCCYQRDIRTQFEAVQARLADDPLNDYVRPFGGGYFHVLPGVRDATDFYARALLG
jgi:deferrochelatase/peroxidase EfeB